MELTELEAAGLNASLYGPPADRVGSSLQAAKVAAARRNIAAKRRFIRFSMFYIYLSAFTSRTQRTAGSFGEVE